MTKRSRVLVGAAVVVALAAAWWSSEQIPIWLEGRRLPELPAREEMPGAMAQALKAADEAAREQPRDAQAVGELCMAYHANGYVLEAERCYGRAAELAPEAGRWTYYRALLAEERGDVQAAAELLEEALSREPSMAVGWYRLARAELKRGRLEAAKRAFEQAVQGKGEAGRRLGSRTFPMQVYATLGLARVAWRRGDRSAARAKLEEVIERAPGFGPAYRLLGRIEREEGHEERAGELTERAGQLAAYHPPADPFVDALSRRSYSSTFLLKQLGIARQSGNAAWAEYLARRAVEANPQDVEAVAALGLHLLAFGRVDEAIPHLEAYRQARTGHDQNLLRMGRGLVEVGRAERALPFLRDAMKVSPRFPPIHEAMCFAFASLGRIDDGIRACELALEFDGDLVDAHINLSALLVQRGKLEDAVQHAREAIRIRPHATGAHNNLAMILFRRGLYEEARSHLVKSLRIDPTSARNLTNLGRVEVRLGRWEQATQHLTEALRLDGANAAAHVGMAEVLSAKGDWRGARRHLGEAARRQPRHPDVLTAMAWLLATCPEAEVRDGPKALELALAASKAMRRPAAWDALAAAHAEVGLFAEAQEAAERALQLAERFEMAQVVKAIRARKAGYARGEPYRQAALVP